LSKSTHGIDVSMSVKLDSPSWGHFASVHGWTPLPCFCLVTWTSPLKLGTARPVAIFSYPIYQSPGIQSRPDSFIEQFALFGGELFALVGEANAFLVHQFKGQRLNLKRIIFGLLLRPPLCKADAA
jgi:hypothetical protein